MQTLYFNGNIITMNDSMPRVEAVLVDDDIIRATGSLSTLSTLADRAARRINLNGATMLPAFIDAHGHFSGMANSLLQVSLDDCTSFAQIHEAIESFRHGAQLAPGEWIIARGYDHNRLAERVHPSLDLLDAAAPENPLVVQHASGHMGVFNSAALAAIGVDINTRSPDSGAIGKLDGRLTGYMEETAFLQYLERVPSADMDALLNAYSRAQYIYAAHGITTIQDGMMAPQMAPIYKQLIARDMLKLDVIGYPGFEQGKPLMSEFAGHVKQYAHGFKIGGYKIFLDGSPQGRTAWMRTPYTHAQDGYSGYPIMTNEAVRTACTAAAEQHLQLLAHCNGDAASAQYINAVEATLAVHPEFKELRPVLIHAQLLGMDQLSDVKKCGLIPSFFVAHVYHWGDTHIENFGIERASEISPLRAALDAGIPFTLHQDAPVIQPDMLETVWCAVNRITREGVMLGAEQRIPVYDALKAITMNAAYQYFEGDTKGSLLPGKRADLVFLSDDPCGVDSMAIRDIGVLATIKAGQCVYRKQ